MADNNGNGNGDNGLGKDAPWMAKILYQLLKFGPITVFAAVLLAAALGILPNTLTQSAARLDSLEKTLEQHQASTHEDIENVRKASEALVSVGRQICRNTAKTEAVKALCDQ